MVSQALSHVSAPVKNIFKSDLLSGCTCVPMAIIRQKWCTKRCTAGCTEVGGVPLTPKFIVLSSSIAVLRKCICRGRRPRRPQIPIIQSRGMPWAASPTIQLFFVNVFVGDGVLDVPKSPEIYCISFYVILFCCCQSFCYPLCKGTTPRRGGEPIKPAERLR